MPIAVFHQGYGNDYQLWCSQYDDDGATWSQDTPVEPPGGLDLWLAPSPVVGFGGVTVFHQGWNSNVGADGNIWSTYSPDGVNWDQDTLLSLQPGVGGISTAVLSSIAPVLYTGNDNLNGNLYIFYQIGNPTGDPEGPPGIDLPPPGTRVRQNDFLYGQLVCSRYDGKQWYGPYPISNVGLIGAGGSAVNWMGGITVFYQGVDSNYNPDGSLWYAYCTDGYTWGEGTPVSIAGLSGAPSAFVYGDHLCVFYQGPGNNGQLLYSVFDGTNWEYDNPVTTLALSGSPSAMQYGDGIAVFHQGGGNDGTLRWAYSSDGSPGNWSGDMLVQNVGLSNSPSALWIPYTAPPPASLAARRDRSRRAAEAPAPGQARNMRATTPG